MTHANLRFYTALIALTLVLSGCAAHCTCPPQSGTTVVTPSHNY